MGELNVNGNCYPPLTHLIYFFGVQFIHENNTRNVIYVYTRVCVNLVYIIVTPEACKEDSLYEILPKQKYTSIHTCPVHTFPTIKKKTIVQTVYRYIHYCVKYLHKLTF